MSNANVSRTGERPDEQIDRFREKARELEWDENEAAFTEKLKMIARHKPKADPVSPAKPAPRTKTD